MTPTTKPLSFSEARAAGEADRAAADARWAAAEAAGPTAQTLRDWAILARARARR